MNNQYFNQQREIAKIRIDTIKGTMKAYAKAKDFKSKSQGVFLSSAKPTSENKLTSFTPVTSQSSRRSGSIEPNYHSSAAENPSPRSKGDNYGGGFF